MLAKLRAKPKIGRRSEDERLRALKHELDKIKTALDHLYVAVESGRLPQDGSLQDRVRKASDATPGHPARTGPVAAAGRSCGSDHFCTGLAPRPGLEPGTCGTVRRKQ